MNKKNCSKERIKLFKLTKKSIEFNFKFLCAMNYLNGTSFTSFEIFLCSLN